MRIKKQINIEIGEQVKLAREQAKLTQEQFADKIDVSPQYVSDLERGVVGISIPTLKKACITLGVSSDQILFGTKAESRAAVISEKTKVLNDEQFSILSEITGKFVEAISKAHQS